MTMHAITLLDPKLRDQESISRSVKQPKPILSFCNLREEPTREDIMFTSLAISLRGIGSTRVGSHRARLIDNSTTTSSSCRATRSRRIFKCS